MENIEIIQLWKSYQQKMDTALNYQNQLSTDVQNLKVRNMLSTMKPVKIFTLIVGVLWVLGGTFLLSRIYQNAFEQVSKFFFFSALLQIGLTAVAIVIYLLQLYWIQQVDVSEPVVKTQEKIANLVSSTLWVTKILFLQLPLWTTFYLSAATILGGDVSYILINGAVTLSFTAVATWLFMNIRLENRHQKWFGWIFNGKEWTPLMKSMEMLEQVNEYK